MNGAVTTESDSAATTPTNGGRHQRQVSAPAIIRNINIGELGRQWSTGGTNSTTDSGQSFVLTQDLQQAWGNESSSFSGWMDRSKSLTNVTTAYHSSIGPQPEPLKDSRCGEPLDVDGGDMVSSIIHDEARIVNWDRVLELCKNSPQHAAYAGPDGWTALHHACNRRCDRADVVEALIHAYPDALLDVEEKGMTPLHYACRFKAPRETVRLLLELYPLRGRPAVSKRDKRGRTPLWYAVRYEAPAGVVEMLLDIDPKAVLDEDSNADSPLALAWETWAEKFEGKKTLQPFLHPEEGETSDPNLLLEKLEANTKLYGRWKQTLKLVKAAFRFSMVKDTPAGRERVFRVVHATCAIKCHPTLFLLSKALYPQQVHECDENDLYAAGEKLASSCQTALHLAAGSPANGEVGLAVIQSLLEINPAAAQHVDGTNKSLPLHVIAENRRKYHWSLDGVADIYEANPMAVQVADKKGRLPLHLATAVIAQHLCFDNADELASCSVIHNLVENHPAAALHADNSGCLPLHILTMNARSWCLEAQAVLDANEAAPRARAGTCLRNRLPIHLAAVNPNAQGGLIEKLVELNPRGTTQADSAGKLPLHLACETGKEWDEGVKAIHDTNLVAIHTMEQNGRGWTALQMAAHSEKASVGLIRELASAYPEAAQQQDKHGRYALHIACESGKSWEGGVQTIFTANPDANIREDNRSMLPFHVTAFRIAKTNQQNEDETKKNKPKRKKRKEEDSQDTTSSRLDLEVLFELLRADPIILPQS